MLRNWHSPLIKKKALQPKNCLKYWFYFFLLVFLKTDIKFPFEWYFTRLCLQKLNFLLFLKFVKRAGFKGGVKIGFPGDSRLGHLCGSSWDPMVFLYQKIKLLQFTFKSGHFVVGLSGNLSSLNTWLFLAYVIWFIDL